MERKFAIAVMKIKFLDSADSRFYLERENEFA